MADKQAETINEALVKRFFVLTEQAKEIDRELKQLKKLFNGYFDATVGPKKGGEIQFSQYILKRQIRKTEKLSPAIVEKLEALNVSDCIVIEKKPDEEKIKAAIQLGFLNEKDIEEFRQRKYSSAIIVREV